MSTSGNSTFMNSLLPLNSGSLASGNSAKGANWFTPKNSATNTNTRANSNSFGMTGVIIFFVAVLAIVGVMYYFKSQISDTWNNAKEMISGYFNPTATPAQGANVPPPSNASAEGPGPQGHTEVTNASVNDNSPTPPSSIMDKILPGSEVFNVSSNRYTYYDAEPLCKALGAELATYDQVKAAWSKGADWCNYGWVKGQMAIYPTSEETYQKLQGGPEDQRQACGRPGMNGGYFDNPEMRFGVTCVGNKPPQNKHDEADVAKGAPLSPDALAFDKKVSQFKSQADHIGILPFNPNKWSS
jgi:hypothetical protein